MQAQRVAPPDLVCKDKFLIQSMVVPFGTAEEDITSDMVRIYQCNNEFMFLGCLNNVFSSAVL